MLKVDDNDGRVKLNRAKRAELLNLLDERDRVLAQIDEDIEALEAKKIRLKKQFNINQIAFDFGITRERVYEIKRQSKK